MVGSTGRILSQWLTHHSAKAHVMLNIDRANIVDLLDLLEKREFAQRTPGPLESTTLHSEANSIWEAGSMPDAIRHRSVGSGGVLY